MSNNKLKNIATGLAIAIIPGAGVIAGIIMIYKTLKKKEYKFEINIEEWKKEAEEEVNAKKDNIR